MLPSTVKAPLPASYGALGVRLAARLLLIRRDAHGLVAANDTDHGDDCICREKCLPPGAERERVLAYHLEDHLAEVEADARGNS